MAQSMIDRRSIQSYSAEACLAAIRGEVVPLTLGIPLIRLCILRGIRYDTEPTKEFAQELYGTDPLFTRALNARRIVSNSLHLLPHHLDPDDIPYCIWRPQTATESSYWSLVDRYPEMKYQVGRACAVANYVDLYRDLDILPEVHIAEEARECGSMEIYNLIMAAPVQYEIMNDYTRTVNEELPKQAWLNGNTAPRWSLEIKQKFSRADIEDEDEDEDDMGFSMFSEKGFNENIFNITEDMNVDEYDSPPQKPRYDLTTLLSEPLPRHLPTAEKDLLILMAAYYGNIDRYVRLRRPKMVQKEIACCVRGIYHNTQFALWWSRQLNKPAHIAKAIHARLIMNNILSTVNSSTPVHELPYLIWYPTVAKESTYRELYNRQPSLGPQILRACLVGDFKDLFGHVLKATTPGLAILHIVETKGKHDAHYKRQLIQRASESGLKPRTESRRDWRWDDTGMLERSHNDLGMVGLLPTVGTEMVCNEWGSLYNGLQCDVSALDFRTCLPEPWRLPIFVPEDDELNRMWVELDYVNWPRL